MKKSLLFLVLCAVLLCVSAVLAEDAAPPAEFPTLPAGENTGSLRVQVFNDKNGNGFQGNHEDGMPGVTVCLMRGEDVVTGAVTGEDGIVLFENVPAGVYETRTWLPDDWAFSNFGGEGRLDASAYGMTTQGFATSGEVTVAAGAEAVQGVGIQTSYHVGGFCWEEMGKADGLYTEEDQLLGGVRITLDGKKNGLHYETVSNEDGTWRIDRVRPALYVLTVYVPEGLMFTKHTGTPGVRSVFTQDGVTKAAKEIDLNDKVSKEKQNIGFRHSAEVRGICYLDANYNGYYDEGEEPLAGVKMVVLKSATDEHLVTTFSGEDGRFKLSGLKGATYKIKALLPDDDSNFTRTAEGDLGNHFVARSDRRENFWVGFVLEDEEIREIAVGVIYPATLTGTVYMDDDFSATLSGKEKIVSNYLVSLADEAGNIVAADKTSVKGLYEIKNVPPGTYRLSVQAVKGYAFTKQGEGNVILNKTGGEGYSEPIEVHIGDKISGLDIGMIRPGTVEGDVFTDRNDNGLRDAGENGMEGVTVRLVSGEGEEAFRTEIGADGHFLFDAVMPGQYYVEYLLPENTVIGRTAAGGNGIPGEGTSGRTDVFDFKTGGYQQAPLCGVLTLGRIDGTAYQDHNGNGTQDPGEETLAGMTVKLIPSREDLEEITAVTGADGAFALADLRPDDYTLEVTCPEGFAMSRTDSLDLPLSAGKTTQQAAFTLSMGDTRTGQMAGAVIPAAIRGRVWMDENNNGLFDEGELTPAGLAVTVIDESTGNVFDTPVTDAEGYFDAAGMIPGSFAVTYPLDEDTIAPNPGDSQFTEQIGALVFAGIRLGENETRDNLLLGIVRYTTISGQVWIDRGGTVEPLPGAAVSVMDETGDAIATMVSGEDGTYAFTRLMPGTYGLRVMAPEGCVIIEPDDSRLDGTLRSVMTETLNRSGSSDPIILLMDRDQTGLDIGCVLPGGIGDVCWLDLNGDGLQGAGEGGIPGVRIEAQRDGVTVAETVTDQYGFYRIPDLYPAVYTLKVTPPAEVKPAKQRTDVPLIVSVLEETDGSVCWAYDIAVESNRPNYNADLGFVLRKDGVFPAGYGEGARQKWQ